MKDWKTLSLRSDMGKMHEMLKQILIMFSVITISCNPFETIVKPWNLAHVEITAPTTITGDELQKEVEFRCNKSSNKFGLILYFPLSSVIAASWGSDSLKIKYLEMLDGFHCSIIDSETGEEIRNYEIDFSAGHRGRDFGNNPLFFLYMGKSFSLSDGSKYKILIKALDRNSSDLPFENLECTVVLGISRPVYW